MSYASSIRQAQINSRKYRDEIINEKYTFPGFYPKYAVTSDGGALCAKCCKEEHKSIGFCYPNDGWQIIGIEVNYEEDIYCSHCNSKIETAFD